MWLQRLGRQGKMKQINRVSRRGTVTARPYTSIMAHEDTVLEEAMDNLKEAGQRIRAT
jgi:hypothetical protein